MLITECIRLEIEQFFKQHTNRALKAKFPEFSETTLWRMKVGHTKLDLHFVYILEKKGYIKPLKHFFK